MSTKRTLTERVTKLEDENQSLRAQMRFMERCLSDLMGEEKERERRREQEAEEDETSGIGPFDWLLIETFDSSDPYRGWTRVGVVYFDYSRTECPACREPLNTLATMGERAHNVLPGFGVCAVCTAPFRIDSANPKRLVLLTDEELEQLHPEIARAILRTRQMLSQ